METTSLVNTLNSLGLEAYLENFIEQGIDDSLLPDLSDDDLKALGVAKLGDRKKLLNSFASFDFLDDTFEELDDFFDDDENFISGEQTEKIIELYEKGFDYWLEDDHESAVAWFRKAAEQGHAWSQAMLGEAYRDGKGVAQNHHESVAWARKAAEQGHAFGQSILGQAYWFANGLVQDYGEAVVWFRKSAKQGHAWSQVILGEAYRDGKGVEQNHREAVAWYRKAAEQGHAGGQAALALAYIHGRGVRKNYKKGVKMLQQVCHDRSDELQYVQARTFLIQLGETC
jgi:TPR repeat protein